jgi:hypothetical protein
VKLPPPFYAKTALRSLNFKVKIPVIVLVLLRVLIHWGFILLLPHMATKKKKKIIIKRFTLFLIVAWPRY